MNPEEFQSKARVRILSLAFLKHQCAQKMEEGRDVCSRGSSRACSKTLGALSILAPRKLLLPPVSCRPLVSGPPV